MGTISDKLTYLNTTKTKIREAINSGGEYLDATDTFRSYANAISQEIADTIKDPDTAWNNFPKVTGEGTELILNNTYASKMKINLKGNTSQNGTPTPDSPIPVNVVSGDNTITSTGKNILPLSSSQTTIGGIPISVEDGIIKLNGTTNSNSNWYTNIFQLNSGSAVFSLEVTGYTDVSSTNASVIIQQSDTGSSPWATSAEVSLRSDRNKYKTLTLDSTKYYRFRLFADSNTFTNATLKVQLEYGSSKTDFVPYVSSSYQVNLGSLELCKIGDYQDYFLKENEKWYKVGMVGKLVVDENSGLTSATSNTFRVPNNLTTNIVRPLNSASLLAILSNYLRPLSWDSNWNNQTGFISMLHTGETDTRIKIYGTETLTELNTWLSTHNIEIYYKCITPTTTEITYQPLIEQLNNLEKAMSYNGQTNISQVNNDLPFIISASALKEWSE